MPIGTSISPPRATLPASEKTFVPSLLSVPSAAKASAPLRKIQGSSGEGLDVVHQRRAALEPRSTGIRRPQHGHAASPLERRDERGLLAADEGAGALHDAHVEVEARAQDVVAEEAALRGPSRWPPAIRAKASGYSSRM